MVASSDLPNELLYEILRLTLPEDLENFAQISKRVQEVARPLLRDHRALIRKYCSFESFWNVKLSIISLLRDVLSTPQVGHYVREANVVFDQVSHDYNDYTDSEIEWLCKIAAESKYLAPLLDVHSLQTDIQNYSESAAFTLLLPLLPNLGTLCMKETWAYAESWVTKVVSNAPKAANPFLTKLTRICLTYNPDNYGVYLENLIQYASLPAMKELSAPGLTGGWNYSKYFCFPALVSGVTRLELLDCKFEMDSEDLCSFLEDFPRLEVFKFSTSGEIDGSRLNAILIKDTLLATVKTSLRTLTILFPEEHQGVMGSLRDFEVLVELHTNWSLLINRDRNLQTVLPASLHDLKLDDKMLHNADTYKQLMEDALSGNLSGVLQLERVTLTTPEFKRLGKNYRCLQQECKEQGLTLTIARKGT